MVWGWVDGSQAFLCYIVLRRLLVNYEIGVFLLIIYLAVRRQSCSCLSS
jgi:hypothetical protein